MTIHIIAGGFLDKLLEEGRMRMRIKPLFGGIGGSQGSGGCWSLARILQHRDRMNRMYE
jgi:pantothenate kinase-related protein Tda10